MPDSGIKGETYWRATLTKTLIIDFDFKGASWEIYWLFLSFVSKTKYTHQSD